MAKVSKLNHSGMEAYVFDCPGCKMQHMPVVGYEASYKERTLTAGRGAPQWGFNGDINSPTFTPSLLIREYEGQNVVRVCHFFIKNGTIEFLNDCTHPLKGRTVPMAEVGDDD